MSALAAAAPAAAAAAAAPTAVGSTAVRSSAAGLQTAATTSSGKVFRIRSGLTNVIVRTGGGVACVNYPSTTNCPTFVQYVQGGNSVTVFCQTRGQTVGTNPWWVYLRTAQGRYGFMASWWIDYPYNVLPGVPTTC